jgi:catechol 2,3-dioxygenase-like lactoylglutathione lyase family enzyme
MVEWSETLNIGNTLQTKCYALQGCSSPTSGFAVFLDAMVSSAEIICFVATRHPANARRFYEKTLGLKFVADEPFALVFEANGIMLRVSKVEELAPATHAVLGWKVTDIRAAIRELTERGVRFERFPGLPQDGSGVWTSPSGGQVAWFKDPDGNTLSITQFGQDS